MINDDYNLENKYKKNYKLLNFNHLMYIYERNYVLIEKLLKINLNELRYRSLIRNNYDLCYESLLDTQYTSIFKLYYRHRPTISFPSTYHIKSDLIFTIYKDVKLLQAKTTLQHNNFKTDIDNLLKTNLEVFLWLKNII